MSNPLPLIVAAPEHARTRLKQMNILPSQLFRNLATEPLWTDQSAPAIYLWPYEIPYGSSEKLFDEVSERVGDVPAFFGMDPNEQKDHQERMLSKILFGSVVVHVVFLDNRETDTTPDREERNETYAQFCSFDDIIQWSRNLKKVMEVRFLHNRSVSRHILVIIASGQQVTTTQKEIEALNDCIGKSEENCFRPFNSCYFLDLNLNPGQGHNIIHSKYVWDVMVSRLLLAMLLAQEKRHSETEEWDHPGVKVWRAADGTFSVNRDSCQTLLKDTMEKAAKSLQSLVSEDENDDGKDKRGRLLEDVSYSEDVLHEDLQPTWKKMDSRLLQNWPKPETGHSPAVLLRSLFGNWSEFPAIEYRKEVESKEHWQDGFAKMKVLRTEWSAEHPPQDYTSSVQDFFIKIKQYPGELNSFANQLSNKIYSTYEKIKGNSVQAWKDVIATETKRRNALKTLQDDSNDFKLAQDYYVGRGAALLIAAAVTGFLGWIIWQTFSIFNIGIAKILLFSMLVFAGSCLAYLVMMLLHNIAGNRGAARIAEECQEADRLLTERDTMVRKLFSRGVAMRDTLALQNVRFRTWLLAKRTLSILETELQPQLSMLADGNDQNEAASADSDGMTDPDHVRDAFIKMTRETIGTFRVQNGGLDNEIEKWFMDQKNPESFRRLWKNKLCAEDQENAGYYPSRLLISQIRAFVMRFLDSMQRKFIESSISSSDESVKNDLDDKLAAVMKKMKEMEPETFLSAALPAYRGQETTLFVNSAFLVSEHDCVEGEVFYVSKSDLLEKTPIAVLYFQEYNVKFALQPLAGARPGYGQLTFEILE